MRIGIDCRMYSSRFTGIGRYVFELTRNLFQIDQENEYVLFFNNPEFEEFKPPAARITKVLVNAPHYSLQEQTVFLKHLQQAKLDLMHFTHFNAPVLYRKPSIVTIHDLTLSFFSGRKMTSFLHRAGYQFILKQIVTRSKKIIAVSKNTKKDLQKLFKIPDEKIAVIYLGVSDDFHPIQDQKQLSAVKKKFNITKDFLLYTGVWRSHKNLKNLLQAFSILRKKHKFNEQLVITGREDPLYAPELKSMIKNLKLKQNVIFSGLVSEKDLINLYNAASIYVFPSLYEGFGLPPLEAMQCGTPVAASNTSSIPEICGEENAVFFDPYNPEDMAEKIFDLYNNKEKKDKHIENGFQHVQKFSWEKMAQQTLAEYKKALGKKRFKFTKHV